ncbi:MAG TPA: MAPEG family protein [Croceibacterium sp.]|nr:MAPEG family protein [Croceibacterium sp.]
MIGVGTLPPVIVLAAWTMVMWAWMYRARMPELRRAALSEEELSTLTQARLDQMLPPSSQWKAHNYNHLHEAPTVFYAVALVLAVIGQGDGLSALLAWLYVVLRIAHSLIHATNNRVMRRFVVFTLSSVVLMALILRAAIAFV